jgi:hypothetical protein
MRRLASLAPSLLPLFLACRPASAEDWLKFRGPARDRRFLETALSIGWPTGGPKLPGITNNLGDQTKRACR